MQTPPVDRGQATAIIVFILGFGSQLPWHFFVTATQYFNDRLMINVPAVSGSANTTFSEATKDYRFNSWMTILSQLPLLLFTLLNSILYQWVSEKVRIAFSMVSIMLLFALTAALVPVPLHPDTFFSTSMATIWFINTFSAVLQGSLFGIVGLFPSRYTTLFMSGQGLGGVLAAFAMLLSILSNVGKTSAAMGYFITPCLATLGALLCYLLLPRLEFARFILNKTHLIESPTAAGQTTSQEQSSVLAVFKKIWVLALCATFCFAVTLSVYPVITVRVQTFYKANTAWDKVFTCVCVFIVFTAMDSCGRGAPSLLQWPSKESLLLPVAVGLRVTFIPLLLMCNIPDSSLPVLFYNDWAFVTIMALFSFSNGYFASLCMTYAPQLVAAKDGETAGALMAFFPALGLSLGASFSFLLAKLM